MNEELESLGEKIIALHKEKGGTFDWQDLSYKSIYPANWTDDKQKSTNKNVILERFFEMELVKKYGSNNEVTILTGKGWAFTTFKKYYQEQDKKRTTERRSDWQKRNWFIADALKVLFGALVGFALRVATEPKQNQSTIQQPPYLHQPKMTDSLQK